MFFERERNWSGLLIEANKNFYGSMTKKNRNAFLCSCCLSPSKDMQKIAFVSNMGPVGGLINTMYPRHLKIFAPRKRLKTELMDCFPFVSILKTIGRNHVDIFSLDIEGGELAVLETIPLNTITINVFMIEFLVNDDRVATQARLKSLQMLFARTGLYQPGVVVKPIDVVFVRKDFNASRF